MWCIYQYEKEDIILYYCAPGTTNGAEFVHRLTDNGKHERGASLVKLVERLVVHIVKIQENTLLTQQMVSFARPVNYPLPLSQLANPPSPPPKV